MSVILRCSNAVPGSSAFQYWLAVGGTTYLENLDQKLPGLEKRLEKAFVVERKNWWKLGKALSRDNHGDIAHMPTAGSFGSDFGIMLAWTRLVEDLAKENYATLVICDDPWLFRQLSKIKGVNASTPPSLLFKTLKYFLRGFFSRVYTAFRNAKAACLFSYNRDGMKTGESWLLVYGHPESNARGMDAYFGDLMDQHKSLKRVLHTDCSVKRAFDLTKDGRTKSLHAWGSIWFAFSLLFCRWRPDKNYLIGSYGWLIRRAVAIENSGGSLVMNRWQAHCQEQWLKIAKPSRIAWPWENHGWERNLCRAAINRSIKTIGYQHTVIGPHQFNYAIFTNHDGLASIPKIVVANGPAYFGEMLAWGMPIKRLVIGGAFRFPRFENDLYDPQGPIFVPLSAISDVAYAQLNVANMLASKGRRVFIKPHPMYPIDFSEKKNLMLTDRSLAKQRGLSAVLYSTGASGLEAVLMGVPGYRLTLDNRIAIDVLPEGVKTKPVTVSDATEVILAASASHSVVNWDKIFSDPDIELWEALLFGDIEGLSQQHKEI